jgi:UDP-N-acetyl-D-glucosamine dehydrogenase
MIETPIDLFGLLEQKRARVGIIGLGYVGIPLALRFSVVGFPVLGFDIDEERVVQLSSGNSPIEHIPDERVCEMLDLGFEATSDFTRIGEADAVIICVPTPLNKHREPDLSFVEKTMETITPHLRPGQILSLESTTWPGTTEEVLRPFIESRGLVIGEDFYLLYSPEREDPGNSHYTTRTIPKVIGGATEKCLKAGRELYGSAVDEVVPVASTQIAELVKLLENIHRAVNIGLVNEMKTIADRMGIDIFDVIDAAATKPFGFTPYYPGPGLGGHCIPIDPFYLTWKAREFGLSTHFIELAGEINREMPRWVVEKIADALNDRRIAMNGAKILALGVAYKRDVDDMRESPAVEVMELLRGKGGDVAYSDPHVPVFPRMRHHSFDLKSMELTPEALAAFDAVVILTDHTDFPYDMILEHARLIIDTRGRYREPNEKVIRA